MLDVFCFRITQREGKAYDFAVSLEYNQHHPEHIIFFSGETRQACLRKPFQELGRCLSSFISVCIKDPRCSGIILPKKRRLVVFEEVTKMQRESVCLRNGRVYKTNCLKNTNGESVCSVCTDLENSVSLCSKEVMASVAKKNLSYLDRLELLDKLREIQTEFRKLRNRKKSREKQEGNNNYKFKNCSDADYVFVSDAVQSFAKGMACSSAC